MHDQPHPNVTRLGSSRWWNRAVHAVHDSTVRSRTGTVRWHAVFRARSGLLHTGPVREFTAALPVCDASGCTCTLDKARQLVLDLVPATASDFHVSFAFPHPPVPTAHLAQAA